MSRDYITVRLCADCHLAAHGYDEHETGHPMPLVSRTYTDNGYCDEDEAAENHPGEECQGECWSGFSWSACDNEQCLEPHLGGDRYRYAYWHDEHDEHDTTGNDEQENDQ